MKFTGFIAILLAAGVCMATSLIPTRKDDSRFVRRDKATTTPKVFIISLVHPPLTF